MSFNFSSTDYYTHAELFVKPFSIVASGSFSVAIIYLISFCLEALSLVVEWGPLSSHSVWVR